MNAAILKASESSVQRWNKSCLCHTETVTETENETPWDILSLLLSSSEQCFVYKGLGKVIYEYFISGLCDTVPFLGSIIPFALCVMCSCDKMHIAAKWCLEFLVWGKKILKDTNLVAFCHYQMWQWQLFSRSKVHSSKVGSTKSVRLCFEQLLLWICPWKAAVQQLVL